MNINDPIEELECMARVEGAKYGKENRIRQLPRDAHRLTKLELLMWYFPVNQRAIEWAKPNIEGFQQASETDPYTDYKPVRKAIRVIEAFRNAALKEQPWFVARMGRKPK